MARTKKPNDAERALAHFISNFFVVDPDRDLYIVIYGAVDGRVKVTRHTLEDHVKQALNAKE